jgi:tetratricopeptide (TPR) repeat protein
MASRSIEAPFYLSRARDFFNESLNLNPLNSEVWLAKAFLEVETGNAQEAEKCFKGALDNDPNNPACYFYLSDYYLSRGDFPQAIQASRDGISLAHDFFNDRLQRIWANTQDINLLQGLIPPGFNQGCFLLAQHLYNCKQYQQSINQLQMCDNETRWEKPFFLLAGQNYLALNKPDSAEYYFRRGVNTKPHEIRNLRMLALLLTSQGRDKEVEELFDNALKNNIDLRKAPLHYEYAVYFGKKKDFSSQRKEITKALLEEVNNITYLELLAESYLGEQRYYEALKELRRAEKLDNRRVNTLRQIAGIYEQLGQTERAKEYCRKILTISPDDVFALKMIPKLSSSEHSSAGRSNGI